MKFLIVEDQKYPRSALKTAVMMIDSSYSLDFSTNYSDARDKISSNSYDVVLLDHRMPMNDVGDLESKDMKAFSASLENIGYSLIPVIESRNPRTIIIGTSSLSKKELGELLSPDFTIRKTFDEAKDDLEKILQEVAKKWAL